MGDSSAAAAAASNYRCGIKTCRKCSLFSYYVRQKQQCLWDEWRELQLHLHLKLPLTTKFAKFNDEQITCKQERRPQISTTLCCSSLYKMIKTIRKKFKLLKDFVKYQLNHCHQPYNYQRKQIAESLEVFNMVTMKATAGIMMKPLPQWPTLESLPVSLISDILSYRR